MFAKPTDLPSLLSGEYTPSLVILSILVAVVASFVALDVAGRIMRSEGPKRLAWIAAAATAMGGGIWSMHFIAMLAFGLPVPIRYDHGLTLISLAIAIGATGVSFSLVAASTRLYRLLPAGLLMGLGIVLMHYFGMEAMRLDAVLTYEPRLLVLSVVIAIVASTVALWLATHDVSLFWKIGASLLMGVAVCGMHYVGMEAACFSATGTMDPALEPGADGGLLALLVALGTLAILALAFISSFIDRRFSAYRCREIRLMEMGVQRLKGLIQATSDLILVVDHDNRIDFVGPSAEAAIGRPAETLAGLPLAALLGEEHVAELSGIVAGLAPEMRFDLDRPIRLAMPDGTERVFDVSVTNLLGQPAVHGMVMTFHDVTLRQRAADELQIAMEMADQANRMKTQFMANMSHELRTPLNAVIGLSELIAMQIDGPLGSSTYREYAEDIKRSGLRLLEVINDVLDIARLEADEVELREGRNDALDLATEASSAVAAAAAAKGVAVTVAVDGRPLLCDGRRIVQSLTKLLSNAVKFSGENGNVAVGGRIIGDNYAFTVDDDGIGIASETREILFKPFFQGDGSLTRRHEGSGLGLPIALGLARLHGGNVELSPRAGGGTRATLYLPASRALDIALSA